MFRALFLLPIFLLCMCTSNNELDCSLVDCATDFSNLYLEVLDSDSKENVFAKGIYTADDISINGSETITFQINDVLENEILVLSDPNWKIGEFDYTLHIGDTNEFKVRINLERSGGEGCCSNRLFLKSLNVNGQSEDIESTSIFSILVE